MKNRNGRSANDPIAIIAVVSIIFIGLACTCGGGRSDQEWNRVLAYKKLSRASNSGAVSDKVNFFFCPSGDYAMQTQFSGFSGGGAGTLSMASEDVEWDAGPSRTACFICGRRMAKIANMTFPSDRTTMLFG